MERSFSTVLSSWLSQLIDRLLNRPTPVPARVVVRPDDARVLRRR